MSGETEPREYLDLVDALALYRKQEVVHHAHDGPLVVGIPGHAGNHPATHGHMEHGKFFPLQVRHHFADLVRLGESLYLGIGLQDACEGFPAKAYCTLANIPANSKPDLAAHGAYHGIAKDSSISGVNLPKGIDIEHHHIEAVPVLPHDIFEILNKVTSIVEPGKVVPARLVLNLFQEFVFLVAFVHVRLHRIRARSKEGRSEQQVVHGDIQVHHRFARGYRHPFREHPRHNDNRKPDKQSKSSPKKLEEAIADKAAHERPGKQEERHRAVDSTAQKEHHRGGNARKKAYQEKIAYRGVRSLVYKEPRQYAHRTDNRTEDCSKVANPLYCG